MAANPNSKDIVKEFKFIKYVLQVPESQKPEIDDERKWYQVEKPPQAKK